MDSGSEFLKEGAILEFLLNKDLNVVWVTVHLLSNPVKPFKLRLKGVSPIIFMPLSVY